MIACEMCIGSHQVSFYIKKNKYPGISINGGPLEERYYQKINYIFI